MTWAGARFVAARSAFSASARRGSDVTARLKASPGPAAKNMRPRSLPAVTHTLPGCLAGALRNSGRLAARYLTTNETLAKGVWTYE